jgi:hypothetical protein
MREAANASPTAAGFRKLAASVMRGKFQQCPDSSSFTKQSMHVSLSKQR